jgi:hydrophobic/amphiphilic exporter-1 (mainly G- bacteria), HAE1 family
MRSITVTANADAAELVWGAFVTKELQELFLGAAQSRQYGGNRGAAGGVLGRSPTAECRVVYQHVYGIWRIALLAMNALLTMQFQSYIQPAFIMAIISFGFVGAILGIFSDGIELTLFSPVRGQRRAR